MLYSILEMRLFGLLSEPSHEVTNEEMGNAYGEFVEHVKNVSCTKDKNFVFRILNLTRIEIVTLEPLYQYGQGKKCA